AAVWGGGGGAAGSMTVTEPLSGLAASSRVPSGVRSSRLLDVPARAAGAAASKARPTIRGAVERRRIPNVSRGVGTRAGEPSLDQTAGPPAIRDAAPAGCMTEPRWGLPG